MAAAVDAAVFAIEEEGEEEGKRRTGVGRKRGKRRKRRKKRKSGTGRGGRGGRGERGGR